MFLNCTFSDFIVLKEITHGQFGPILLIKYLYDKGIYILRIY